MPELRGGAIVLAGVLALAGCRDQEKLFDAQFENAPVGETLPAPAVGSYRFGEFGMLRVVGPPDAQVAGNWLQLSQGAKLLLPAALRAVLVAQRGPGNYLITLRLYVPAGMSAFVSCASSNVAQPTEFVTAAFPDVGPATLNGTPATGGFPHDRTFSVAINVTIGATSTATLTLLGAAHGTATVTVPANLTAFAQTFQILELETDPHFAGDAFFANDLSVIYSKPAAT